jgi:hypothetical protein
VGPEATRVDTVMSIGLGVLGAGIAPRASRAPRSCLRDLVLAALALDLWGGAWANNTLACARWYERPGQRSGDHLRFACFHLHPFVLALLDSGKGRRAAAAWRGAVVHYGFLIASTAMIRHTSHRRPFAAVLTAAGVVLDAGVGRSVSAPWFAPVFYTKLLFGHAGAALWTDARILAGKVKS